VKEKFLKTKGLKLFDDRFALLTLWQEIAEIFYPERADFTLDRWVGEELSFGLSSSDCPLVRRDLANSIGGILRPTNKHWFHMRTDRWDAITGEGRAWLERAEERQRRAMYYRFSGFSRATKEADADFITFGQAVIQVSLNTAADNLLYRCWHLRDCAWSENADGIVDTVFRKCKYDAQDLVRMFPRTVHQDTRDKAKDHPYDKCEIWHCVVPADTWAYHSGEKQSRFKYISVYFDVEHDHILEEVPSNFLGYVIPRWQTMTGSQYAYSPATAVALPEGRTNDALTNTLLEAGEKAVTPPLIGVQGALRSDLNVMAGGVTWVDREYDERLGEVLRPLTVDKSGIPLGLDMRQDSRATLRESFYLNKLTLPPQDVQMTAYEVGQRVQEYIRQAMPLFEPVEYEYNAPLCEHTFDILMQANVFGSPLEIPEDLRGKTVIFNFESPLHDAVERARAQKFLEASGLIANAAGMDESVIHVLNTSKAARDALQSSGTPAGWLRSQAEVDQILQAQQEARQAEFLLQQMQAGANVAKTIGDTQAPAGTGGTGIPLT